MHWVYLVTAIVGGAVLLVQTGLSLVGLSGGDDLDGGLDGHDGDVGHDADSFFKFLSLRVVVAFFTFFGLTGLACERAGVGATASLLSASAAGLVALFLVAQLMSWLARLQSEGNLHPEQSVGAAGRVYLRVPAARVGEGKVTAVLQGRSVELRAVTDGPEIPTGAAVRIVAVLGPRLVAVAPGEEE